MNTDYWPLFRMFSDVPSPCITALACVLVMFPHTSGALELDSIPAGACRGAACETRYAGSPSALLEIRGSAPADARRLLDLTIYNAATYEIAYYDTSEAASGDFAFTVPLRALRPGSYAFTVARRYSGTPVAGGVFTAAPGMLPPVPAWAPQTPEEFRR
jgi:hypothetical protein